jgi:hypothetical protein
MVGSIEAETIVTGIGTNYETEKVAEAEKDSMNMTENLKIGLTMTGGVAMMTEEIKNRVMIEIETRRLKEIETEGENMTVIMREGGKVIGILIEEERGMLIEVQKESLLGQVIGIEIDLEI